MTNHVPPAATPLDPRERARVHAWLRKYGRWVPDMTPLTERRYAARYHAYRIELAAAGLVALFFAGQFAWRLATGTSGGTTVYLVGFVAAYAVLAGSSLVGLRHQRRVDRSLAAAMRHRVARPTAVRPAHLLGGAFVVAAAVTYAGALGVGAGSLLAAADPGDRALSVVFTVSAALFAGYAAAVATDAINRPAIAEDERTLAEDDGLRREDARQAVAPYLPVLAVVAGAGMSPGGVLVWVYLGYAAAASLAWAFSLRAHRRRRDGTADRTAAA